MSIADTRNKVHYGNSFSPPTTPVPRTFSSLGLDCNIYPWMSEKKTHCFRIPVPHSVDEGSCPTVVLLVYVQSWMGEKELESMIC